MENLLVASIEKAIKRAIEVEVQKAIKVAKETLD